MSHESRCKKSRFQTSVKPMWQSSIFFVLLSLLCIPFIDLELAHTSPLIELRKMFDGLLHPNFIIDGVIDALLHTVFFAIQAVVLSSLVGFCIAQVYRLPGIRALMAFLRSIHELFWALILIQIFGLSSLTGMLALAIPFSATFARVFAEIQQETSKEAYHQLKGKHLSRFIYTTLPLAWPRISSYCKYRFECALRASVVLGFIGLPTIGYQLDSYLKIGRYAEVAALIFIFIGLVLSMRFWANRFTMIILFTFSIILLPPTTPPESTSEDNVEMAYQLLNDITPTPIRNRSQNEIISDTQLPSLLWDWFSPVLESQILPGVGYSLLLGQFAFALSAFLTLLWFPLISKHLIKRRIYRNIGHFVLTTIRCIPEFLLAFIALILLGPSLIPGIIALGLHNGALLAHLVGQYSNELKLRSDTSTATNLYFFELIPRIYGQFLAFTLYRGETILRETAILGILGIPTLGFFIDSAFEEFRLDRAFILILASAFLNIFAEQVSTLCRKHIHAYKPSLISR